MTAGPETAPPVTALHIPPARTPRPERPCQSWVSPPRSDHRRTPVRERSDQHRTPEEPTDPEDHSSCPSPHTAKEHRDEPPKHQTGHRHSSEKAVDRKDDDDEGNLDAHAPRIVLLDQRSLAARAPAARAGAKAARAKVARAARTRRPRACLGRSGVTSTGCTYDLLSTPPAVASGTRASSADAGAPPTRLLLTSAAIAKPTAVWFKTGCAS